MADFNEDDGAGDAAAVAARVTRAARDLARRVANEKYALVFWLEEPRSADVVLKTAVVPDQRFPLILPMQERKVMWGDKAYDARILRTGENSQFSITAN